MRWQLASTFAVTAMSAGCYGPDTITCKTNGALCPVNMVCTENSAEPYCSSPADFNACAGTDREGSACSSADTPTGLCVSQVCTTCEPTPDEAECRFSAWTSMRSPAQMLSAVWVESRTEAYAVAGEGRVFRYDGHQWSELPQLGTTGNRPALRGVWSAGDEVWAVDNAGKVFRNGVETVMQDPVALTRIWGSSTSDVVATGDSGVYGEFDGQNWTWSSPSSLYALSDIWGSGTSVVVVGESQVRRRRAGVWEDLTVPSTDHLYGVWGISDSDFFVVGANKSSVPVDDGKLGRIFRYTDGTWTPVPLDPSVPKLVDIWGASATEVYAVGDRGVIVRFDGDAWQTMPPATTMMPNLAGISGTGRDAIAVGIDGAIWRISPP